MIKTYYDILRLELDHIGPEYEQFRQYLAQARNSFIRAQEERVTNGEESDEGAWRIIGQYSSEEAISGLIKEAATKNYPLGELLFGACLRSRTSICNMIVMAGIRLCYRCGSRRHIRFAAYIRIFAIRQMGLGEDVCNLLVKRSVEVIIEGFSDFFMPCSPKSSGQGSPLRDTP
jgi:hypothetical protein